MSSLAVNTPSPTARVAHILVGNLTGRNNSGDLVVNGSIMSELIYRNRILGCELYPVVLG
jgi:hypothetical protein